MDNLGSNIKCYNDIQKLLVSISKEFNDTADNITSSNIQDLHCRIHELSQTIFKAKMKEDEFKKLTPNISDLKETIKKHMSSISKRDKKTEIYLIDLELLSCEIEKLSDPLYLEILATDAFHDDAMKLGSKYVNKEDKFDEFSTAWRDFVLAKRGFFLIQSSSCKANDKYRYVFKIALNNWDNYAHFNIARNVVTEKWVKISQNSILNTIETREVHECTRLEDLMKTMFNGTPKTPPKNAQEIIDFATKAWNQKLEKDKKPASAIDTTEDTKTSADKMFSDSDFDSPAF